MASKILIAKPSNAASLGSQLTDFVTSSRILVLGITTCVKAIEARVGEGLYLLFFLAHRLEVIGSSLQPGQLGISTRKVILIRSHTKKYT